MNSLRYRRFRHRAHAPTARIDHADRLPALYSDFAITAWRVSFTAAELATVRADEPIDTATGMVSWQVAARALRLAAVLADGCRALDRVTELPELARQTPCQTTGRAEQRAHADLIGQADAVTSVAGELGAVLRRRGCGFQGSLGAVAAGSLGALSNLGPNETDTSLILLAENVSQALSLAARMVLVLTRLRARHCRAHRVVGAFRPRCAAGCAACWVLRGASLPLANDLAHLWRTAPIAPWTVASVGVLVPVVAALLARFAAYRPVRVAADLISAVTVLTVVAFPHAVLVALALVDLVTGNGPGGRGPMPAGRPPSECVGFTNRHPGLRHGRSRHREHRDP